MFIEYNGERFRILLKKENGSWIISYDNPSAPNFVLNKELKKTSRIPAPEDCHNTFYSEKLSLGEVKRIELIQPLINNDLFITDRKARNDQINKIANEKHTTKKRIKHLYYLFLAGKPLIKNRETKHKEETEEQKQFRYAIDNYYYSAKKMSLMNAYELMLLENYTEENGTLMTYYPSWHSFRHFFYDGGYHKKLKSQITRFGLSKFQRDNRPLFGLAREWKKEIGSFQMDATQADIYLVSRLDKKSIIGRPNIYLAVDTVSQLIVGFYCGLESGEQAVINCLVNAASDKVLFCNKYGIEIKKEEWPNTGLPGEIITDKGREFLGSRINELCYTYGVELEALPPYRPDEKSLVERSFQLIQDRFKPYLRGKGIIEPDAQERWATDYRSQATLTIDDFIKILIRCILYLNNNRMVSNPSYSSEIPIPSHLWEKYKDKNESNLIDINEHQLYQFGLKRKEAVLSRKGIKHKGLWYINHEYKKIINYKNYGDKVTIAYDSDDISIIYLINQSQYIPFELASYCKIYTGITDVELNEQMDYIKKQSREFESKNIEARVKLVHEIKQITKNIPEEKNIKKEDIKVNRKKEKENYDIL